MSYISPPYHLLPSMDITDFRENPKERKWTEPFTFVLGADTQFGLIGWRMLQETEPNWDREIALTRDVIKAVNQLSPKPKFFCLCGDILDAYPFSKHLDHPSGNLPRREEQYKDFVQVFKELDPEVKLICVCGNHDMGDIPTTESVEVYRRQFGQDYFSFWVGGVKFVVLNSQYIFSPDAVQQETENQWNFMETIADETAKHIVVFQHIPFFETRPDEAQRWNWNIPRPQRLQYLEKLRGAGVSHIFSGHYHKNSESFYKNIKQVVTAAIGAPMNDDPSGFMAVTVGDKEISYKYIPIRETTAQI